MWTDRSIKAIKSQKRPLRISEDSSKRGGGRLVLEVRPNSAKYFYFRYFRKQKGKSKRTFVSIGRFKESEKTQGFSLSEARDKALEFEQLLKSGLDIKTTINEQALEQQAKFRKIESAKRQGSFDQLIESYLSAMEADGKRSHKSVRNSLQTYLYKHFPEMINRRADTIEADDIRLVLSRMIDKGVTTHTNRVRSYLHAAFSHGLKQDNNPRRYSEEQIKFNLKYNPVSFVPKQADFERVGEHVIPENEIKIIWEQLPKASPRTSWVVKLALTTGQRSGEIIRLKWSDIDFKDKLVMIPSSVSKNKIDHVVPLDKLAWSVIQEIKKQTGNCEYLFPASNNAGFIKDKHVFNTTISKIIREFCKDNKKLQKFLARDIRRTVKTLMGKGGIDKAVRDRIQNHALHDVSSKHYDRYDYLPEKRQAMKVWNDYLNLIINPEKKVTHISSRRT
jgi:integrase